MHRIQVSAQFAIQPVYVSAQDSADSEKVRADQLWNITDQRWCLSCSLNQLWKTSYLWNSADYHWDFNSGGDEMAKCFQEQ